MSEAVCWGDKAWQASALEVERDMQLLGHSQDRKLRPKSRPSVSQQVGPSRRALKELGPFLGLATFLLEREGVKPKRKRNAKPKPLRLSRAATHVAIAHYLARQLHH